MAGVAPKSTLDPGRKLAPSIVTMVPAPAVGGLIEVTSGASLMANPSSPPKLVFDPCSIDDGAGLPVVSLSGVNSKIPLVPSSATYRSPALSKASALG